MYTNFADHPRQLTRLCIFPAITEQAFEEAATECKSLSHSESHSAIPHGRVASLRRALLRRGPGGCTHCAVRRRVSAASTAAIGHGLDVRTVVERLVEVADAAGDVGVAREGEGDDGLFSGSVSCGQQRSLIDGAY